MPAQRGKQPFDVFMCHNSEDKPAVIALAERLEEKGLRPWLDEWELQPGRDWLDELDKQIGEIATAAVFVGASGIGPWQNQEIKAFLTEFVERGCPVIPIMLEGAPQRPDLPRLLRGKTWVDFRRQRPEPFGRLMWGITGEHPRKRKSGNESDLGDESVVPVANGPLITSRTIEQAALMELKGLETLAEQEEVDAHYANLDWYLQRGKWKAANQETYRLMITEVGRDEGTWFSSQELLNFPCEPLRIIDDLWVKYSDGKFGFSVQKKMYLECGGVPDGHYYRAAYRQFCVTNGWRKKNKFKWKKLTFDAESPRGNLPEIAISCGATLPFSEELPESMRVQRSLSGGEDKVAKCWYDEDKVAKCWNDILGGDMSLYYKQWILFSRIQTCEL